MARTSETATVPIPNREPGADPAPRPLRQMVLGCGLLPVLVLLLIVGYAWQVRSQASAQITVPAGSVLLLREAADDAAPLIARFGEGRRLRVIAHDADWRWLEIERWDGQRGWARRPLDIPPWAIRAPRSDAGGASGAPEPGGVPRPDPLPETMLDIPAGTFTMGSPPGLGEADESPAHPVQLSAYRIDGLEVSLGHFWRCVLAGACAAPERDGIPGQPHYLADPANDERPMLNLPWSEAKRYCNWRGKRLPTEAEWERAAAWDARRGAKLIWPWGNSAGESLGEAGPNAVGTRDHDRAPSGALDMGGNVREWVLDWYKINYYAQADPINPRGPSARRGEGGGRVVRGGSYARPIESSRAANRGHEDPAYGYPDIGFRCAQDRED